MGSAIKYLYSKGSIKLPAFVEGGIQYEVIMGSVAYGVSNDTSDYDIYGFCIPSKSMVFPHLDGEIFGFGRQKKRFEQWQQHHIYDKDALGGKGRSYDFAIYNIVKYFHLCMENNPNMIDSLFVPERCILHATKISNMIRDNRKLFLSKKCWHSFKGYSYKQMHKIRIKTPEEGSKRWEIVQKYGYDVKFAYHVVRLLEEVEQILIEHDLNLERNREQLKSIRRGEWSLKDIEDYFYNKERELETIYTSSKLPYSPDESKIKQLLLNCLEEFYGNLDKCIVRENELLQTLKEIHEQIGKVI